MPRGFRSGVVAVPHCFLPSLGTRSIVRCFLFISFLALLAVILAILQTTQLITKYFIHTAAPSLPSLPLPKPAYPVPPPVPQVFIIKENNESPKDQEDSKSAEALDNLSKTFEDAFSEAYKSEERKGTYRHQPRNGRFRQRLHEQDTFDNDSEEPPRNGFRHRLHGEEDPSIDLEQEVIKDIEKEEGEERMLSSVGSRREIARHNSAKNSEDDEDYNNNNDDDLSDNGGDKGDTNGYDDRGHDDNNKADEEVDSEDDDDDDDDSRRNYDNRNDDDNRANMDTNLDTEPSSDADESRHSHSHPEKKYDDYRQGDINRRRIRKKKKYTRYHDYRRGNHPKESLERERPSLAKSNSIRKHLKVRTHTKWNNHKAVESLEEDNPPKQYSYTEKQAKNPNKTTLRSKKYRKSKKTKVKSLKHRLKTQYYPNRNSVPVRYNESKFAHLQERDSGKRRHHHHTKYPVNYHKQLNHHRNGHQHGKQHKQRGDQYKKHQNHHNQQYKNSYSTTGSLLPEDEISESSTFEGGSVNRDHESSISSGSEDPNSPSNYPEGDRHVSEIKGDVNKGLQTLLSTVQSFTPTAHHKLRKNTNWRNIEEKYFSDYSSGEESGENEVSGFEGSHYN